MIPIHDPFIDAVSSSLDIPASVLRHRDLYSLLQPFVNLDENGYCFAYVPDMVREEFRQQVYESQEYPAWAVTEYGDAASAEDILAGDYVETLSYPPVVCIWEWYGSHQRDSLRGNVWEIVMDTLTTKPHKDAPAFMRGEELWG